MTDVNLKTEIKLNNLRDLVLRLESSQKNPIRDDNVLLAPVCDVLEKVLRIGLKRSVLGFGLKKWDYWCWIEALSRSLQHDRQALALLHAITFTKSSKKVTSYQGFGRLFIRLALMKRLMGYVMQTLQKNKKLLKSWYNDSSVFCDKVHTEILKQILDDLDKHVFELNLKNASFLEETWIIPEIKESCIVPCKELGLIVRDVNDRVIVAQVKPNGAAGDAGIEYGDTIDELLGKPLLKIKNCAKVIELLKQNVGKPVSCTVVKPKLSNGAFFPPSAERLKVIQEDPYIEKNDNQYAPQQLAGYDETAVHASDTVASYSALYYGRWETGEDGSVGVIEDGINCVLKQANQPRAVELNLTETDLTVVDKETSKILSVHSFTETSACGRKNDMKDIVAFVSGETSCALAKKFHCYVFKVKDQDIARVILYSIADGFCRTVWFV
ncbi:uncharacterized protein LOC110238612 [Exaiptasia diaphana]|uniref:RUN domain-containing protein n=1 Tax=Exaiptasia diaphana TaxID=2652724 RepID=A0A913X7B6_EXADI|nr:uncharacterized protein LOC110238612 [Exaiptasia diaphana]KXJ28545.1 RUN and FYVE domain-containing protein 4 [Exaiptasia diaphana]